MKQGTKESIVRVLSLVAGIGVAVWLSPYVESDDKTLSTWDAWFWVIIAGIAVWWALAPWVEGQKNDD
jgi:hypothetical protein